MVTCEHKAGLAGVEIGEMLAVEREERILAYIQDHGRGSVSELSKCLCVSEPTIRRDLRRLAARRLIRRVHGGAISATSTGLEPPVLRRRGLHSEEKDRIGQAAAALIQDGETIILMGGSTTLAVVPYLVSKQNLTIVTDSIIIAGRATKGAGITVIMLGGIVRPSELSTEGHLTELCMSDLHAHKAIIGVRAISIDQGLMLDKVSEVTNYRRCVNKADEVIIVADHSKFGQVATAVLGPLTMANHLVTDSGIPAEAADRLRNLGIRLTEA